MDSSEVLTISIHVLRVEDDIVVGFCRRPNQYFNPRPPCGGRPLLQCHGRVKSYISIHVLRVEDDSILLRSSHFNQNFNPRPPCGGRHRGADEIVKAIKISIHVLRVEDDTAISAKSCTTAISIHVLRVEDDNPTQIPSRRRRNFNPRPPCGGRPRFGCAGGCVGCDFNPRPPCGGRPEHTISITVRMIISIHVLRVEDDMEAARCRDCSCISIHVLRVEDDTLNITRRN